MQSIVEVVCVGGGSNNPNKQYNSVYTDPGYCKMVIVQDDDKFPSPRLCLLRRWPNFEGGFGFNLYEDLISQTGALKVEEVVHNSPAEAGGLRKNDVIIEINGDNIEFKSFFRLVEILKEACNQNEMELLVLAEPDAKWYRDRNICVNNNFPNIEYCETPYYGHILKPLESFVQTENGTHPKQGAKNVNSQIEFHSSTGKLYRTTLVIDKEKDSVYRRIEELPQQAAPVQSADQLTVPPLRPDGSYRHPSSDGSVRVYYRRDRECLNTQTNVKGEEVVNATADSGHGSIRRSTPLSTANTAPGLTGMSPYSTLGKSYGEQAAVDLLHDKWADLMDKYLDNHFRSSSAHGHASEHDHEHVHNHRAASTGHTLGKRNNVIRLHDPNQSTIDSKKSRCQSPNDGSFSYLYSGRDDFQSASATSFREINRQSTSPYHHLAQQYQRGPQRYPSPHHSVTSPTRHHSQQHQQRPQSQNRYNIAPADNTSASSSPLFQQYETSYSTHNTTNFSHKSTHESTRHSPGHHTLNSSRSESSSCRAPHSIVLKTQKSQINSLGFQLNESDIVDKGCYFVKYVEPGSASSMAGLKEGDKITKINGKSTAGMSYEQFCYEIVIAQQQQQKNNMIHLMVMRRSAKVNAQSSAATASSSISNLSGPTVLPIKNNFESQTKLNTSTPSNQPDEGYVAASATSSITNNTANVSSSQIGNHLVSVVKVTSAANEVEQDVVTAHQSRPKTPPQKQAHKVASEEPAYVAYESTVSYKPNIIYDNEEGETLRFLADQQKEDDYRREQAEKERAEQEKRENEQRERERFEREEQLKREREKVEREEEEQRRLARQERERLEREREAEYQRARELEQREREERDRLDRAAREREREELIRARRERDEREALERLEQQKLEEELRQKSELSQLSNKSEDPQNVQKALAALTTITVIGSEPINADTYNIETLEQPERINYQVYADEGVKPNQATTQRYPLIMDEIATTTTTKSVNEIENVREQLIEERHPPQLEEESNLNEYATTSQYLPDDLEDLRNESHVDAVQEDENERARQEYAEQQFNKQQEVMGHLVLALNNPEMQKEMRTYNLYKSQHFFGYGIAFHTENISISKPEHKLVYPLIEIESNSPADEAGMKDYQRVVAVNGEFVNADFRTLEDVVQSIEDSYYTRDFTEITVIDSQLWEALMENPELAAKLANYKIKSPSESKLYADRVIDSIISTEIPTNVKPEHKVAAKVENENDKEILPRLCRLTRDTRNDQYGFDFKTLKNEGKHIANNVREGLPASLAGLKEGDYILEVNGESIDGVDHDSVVKKISAHGNMVDLLAVNDLGAYMNYREYMKKPEVEHVDVQQNNYAQEPLVKDDVTHHKLKLSSGSKGLGISLNTNAVISHVDPKSPADKAGLRKNMKIVEVNGKNVQDKTYKEIAKAIKENEKNLTIGAVDMTPQREVSQASEYRNSMDKFSDLPDPEEIQVERPEIIATQSLSSKTGEKVSDAANGARICNLINRPDFDGFGFSMRSNDKGPHQISNVETDSPAHYSGLKADDFVLRVNDVNVVGERYNKTVALIKNESDKGRLKLEVIEPQLCSYEMKNVVTTPAYGTLSSNKGTLNKKDKKNKNQSIDNLRAIATDVIANGSGSIRNDDDRSRAVSVDVADSRKRPHSMYDMDRAPHNATVRSTMSYGSTTTAFSEVQPSNLASGSSKSVTNLQSTSLSKPKFKRCNVQILPDFKGYGFTLNSKVKPKYSIYTIDPNSPAYKANLRETDVIVQIDKKNIRRQKFDKVKQLLSDSQKKGQVEILAIDREGYMYYKNRKKRFSSNKLVTIENTEPFYTLGAVDIITDVNQEAQAPQAERTIGDVISDAIRDNTSEAPAPSTSSQIGVTSASSSRVQLAPAQAESELDHDIIKFTVTRDANKPLGLTISQSVNKSYRSLSRSSTKSGKSSKSKKSKKDEGTSLPIITTIDPDSPAEQSGLRAQDLILEINGKGTNGQSNKKVSEWIRSSGSTIEFTVSREKRLGEASMVEEEIIITDPLSKENARQIAQEALVHKDKDVTEAIYDRENENNTSGRLSRKDSAQLSKRSSERSNSQPGTPKVVHSEIRMSSSRLHQEGTDPNEVSVLSDKSPSSLRSSRNHSEPAPIHQSTVERTSQSDINKSSATPLSRRSASSFTVPRDAPVPRLCRVRAYEDQLGFTVSGSKTNKGVFKVNDVAPNSPASHSGLMNDDYIIEISGKQVENMDYNEVVNFIKNKKMEDDLQLLVADKGTLNWYKSKKISISSQIIPKMQYIETLLKDELQSEMVYNQNACTSTKTFKIPNQIDGQAVTISRKIHLSSPPVVNDE